MVSTEEQKIKVTGVCIYTSPFIALTLSVTDPSQGRNKLTQQTCPALLEFTAQGGRYGQSTNSQMGFLGDGIILIRP